MILVRSYDELISKFKRMRIEHPLLKDVHDQLDILRAVKRDSYPGDEQLAAALLADSHSGKSTAVRMYVENTVVNDCIARGMYKGEDRRTIAHKQKIVVHVTLTPGATVSSLMTDLLKALGDPRPDYGSVRERRYRVYTLLEKLGVELLIIDEVQHLGSVTTAGTATRRENATDVQNNLKNFLIDGYPIMFVGRPEARDRIFGDEQTDLRTEDEISFGPLSMDKEDEWTIFCDFCACLADQMMSDGVLDHVVNLLEGDTPICLFMVSNGRLGLLTKVVRWAIRAAMEEGAKTLTRRHFIAATDRFAARKVLIERNPFTEDLLGLKGKKVARH